MYLHLRVNDSKYSSISARKTEVKQRTTVTKFTTILCGKYDQTMQPIYRYMCTKINLLTESKNANVFRTAVNHWTHFKEGTVHTFLCSPFFCWFCFYQFGFLFWYPVSFWAHFRQFLNAHKIASRHIIIRNIYILLLTRKILKYNKFITERLFVTHTHTHTHGNNQFQLQPVDWCTILKLVWTHWTFFK